MCMLLIGLVTVAVTLAACTDVPTSARGVAPSAPSRAISDAPRGGRQHVYFLPPMVPPPVTAGTFDPALSPVVTICRLTAGSCSTVVAQFTTTTSPAVTVDAVNGEYRVNWDTKTSALDVDLFYRIDVRVGAALVAFADVDPVSSGSGLKNVETGAYIPLVDGRTLPIKFRIETAAIGSIVVSPQTENVPLGESRQFTAQVFDLHGALVPRTVAWSVDDASIATIDASGNAMGLAVGQTQVWAAAGGVRSAASVTVDVPAGPRTPGLFYTLASGPVTVRLESSSGGFTSDAYCNDASGSLLWVGTPGETPVGTQTSLGSFALGAEIFCYIYVRNTGYWYYMGPGTNNADGQVHAVVGQRGDGTIFVGFEEAFGGGDGDFDDLVLTVSPVTYEPAAGP